MPRITMTTKHSTPNEHKLHNGNYHKRINKCKESNRSGENKKQG